jgi:hypothetical protein
MSKNYVENGTAGHIFLLPESKIDPGALRVRRSPYRKNSERA